MVHHRKYYLIALLSFLIISCAPQVELTTSWSNKTAKVKSTPNIMAMALGKDLANRQSAESYLVAYLKNAGYNAIGSLDIFKPEIQKYDSLTMVSLLKQNSIDLLLTNAVVNVSEKQRYVPGSTYSTPVGTYAYPTYPYNYGGYYGYYGNRSDYYYRTVYETQTTPGYTVTDVEVLIESNLYDVANSELLWVGQSKSYTKEPTPELFDAFAKVVVSDLTKTILLQK
ncbi:MAG: hypothetical protein ACHQNT_05675 [Bacteroidia bacterium]